MNKTALFTRPSHDLVTSYLFYWSTTLIDEAEKKGYKTSVLDREKANAKELTSRLKKMKPELCVINGHGNKVAIYGHDNKPILDESNNQNLKGSVVYARSCSTGETLGKSCISKGVEAYIGYKNPFWLCYDNSMTHHPEKDKIANYVLTPSNQVVRSLLKGNSASEASTRSKNYSREMMRKLMSSEAPEGANNILACVFSNMKNQVCLGDQSAKV